MSSRSTALRAVVLRMSLMFGFLSASGCDESRRSKAIVEIAPEVTADSLVAAGTVSFFPSSAKDDSKLEPWMIVGLDVPDGSRVLQFKNPVVDIVFFCEGSEQTARGIKCQLGAREGSRSFTFSYVLTTHQRKTLQKVVVKKIYEGTVK